MEIMEQSSDSKPKYRVELTYAEISDLCGIVSLYWIENEFRLDYAKTLMHKLANIKQEIIHSKLN